MQYRSGECFLFSRKIALCGDATFSFSIAQYIMGARKRDDLIVIHEDAYLNFENILNSVVVLREDIKRTKYVDDVIHTLFKCYIENGLDIIILETANKNTILRNRANYIVGMNISDEMFYVDRVDGLGKRVLVKINGFVTSQN